MLVRTLFRSRLASLLHQLRITMAFIADGRPTLAPEDPLRSMFSPVFDVSNPLDQTWRIGHVLTNLVQPVSRDPNTIFPLDGHDLEAVSDAALISLLDTAPILFGLGGATVVRLSRGLAMKAGGNVLPSEAEAMRLVGAETDIPVPRVHRSFQVPDSTQYFGTKGFIVMDYINGSPLDECWTSLSLEAQTKIARQVAEYIHRLQSIRPSQVGPIGGGPCTGRFFTDYSAGPFGSGQEMESWFNHKLDICKRCRQAPQDIPRFCFTSFVLTHQDISPRNLVMERSGCVWVIDWADAGAYPPSFEGAALASQSRFRDFGAMVLALLGSDPVEMKQLKSITYGLTTAAWA